MNIAGNAENIPPKTGPNTFDNNTAVVIINPPKTDLINRDFDEEGRLLPETGIFPVFFFKMR